MSTSRMPQTVLITGASSGLGAALAARYAARGDQVLLTDLKPPPQPPPNSLFRRLDITSPQDWNDAMAWMRREVGHLDMLINNAGVAAGGRIDAVDVTQWRRVFDINVLGAVNGCQAVTPLMKARRRGHIVNIASLAGLVHPPAMGAYNASKAAIVALSETLRHELRPWGIDVSVVCPSFFRSALATSLSGEDPLTDAVAAKLIARAARNADQIAARAISGIDRRRFLILPDRRAVVASWMKRLARPLYDRQMFAAGVGLANAEHNELPAGIRAGQR
ncbi:MAG TPA: SDR family NAD(P)-dependent oxidoreductase [Mycobacterium sp.]|nr:SDR family NAD(P)-dependent oxidoreductase [Mycobacterium sp.]